MALADSPGRMPEGQGGSTLHLACLRTFVFASAPVRVGREPQPGRKVFCRGPFGHIPPHFRQKRLNGGGLKPWNLRQIDPVQFIDVRPGIIRWRIAVCLSILN